MVDKMFNQEQAKGLANYCFDLSKGYILAASGSLFVLSSNLRFSVFLIAGAISGILLFLGLTLLKNFE